KERRMRNAEGTHDLRHAYFPVVPVAPFRAEPRHQASQEISPLAIASSASRAAARETPQSVRSALGSPALRTRKRGTQCVSARRPGARWATPQGGDTIMKLYMHPASTACRPVMLFAAESNIPLDNEMVDVMTGAHHREPYATLNPNRLIPLLEDGDFRLTESSAILKYLADKTNSPAYPKDLKLRARVNEMMDWLNVNFYRDFGYGLVYPQL